SRTAAFEVLPDARDVEQLSKNNVTHILSIHDSARPMLEGMKYLCIPNAGYIYRKKYTRHFRESIKFIHECRLAGEGCLVHWYVYCLLKKNLFKNFSTLIWMLIIVIH
uniref:Dual specificity protein phosphatase n=1 Tax=Zosterops lateralis melanops TaxID=1220523 RepID=A0A8D2QLJ4_ZOSLA